jgi:hypothetical protein
MTVERAIALFLHGLETIQNPYAVLFKGLVHSDEADHPVGIRLG